MFLLKINLKERSYKVRIGKGILKDIGNFLKEEKIENDKIEIFVITSPLIRKIQGKPLENSLKKSRYRINFIEIEDREKNKNLKTYEFIVRKIKVKDFLTPYIIAFGGGVVGDISGFVAGTYRRGIPYIVIPTTLLSQVDSSIGGKVGIDLKYGKNLLGLFYQPKLVLSDILTLLTLPEREIRSGISEVIKYGIISDAKFFEYLEKNILQIITRNIEKLEYVIYRSAKIKKYFIEKDEKDEIEKKGVRAILNYGHTIGHSLESATSYRVYTHGEAVAIGMCLEAEISFRLGILKEEELIRIKELIKKAGLPTFISKVSPEKVLENISFDKKFTSGKMRFALPVNIGEAKIFENLEKKLIREVIFKNTKL